MPSRLDCALKTRAHALAARWFAPPEGTPIPSRVERILVTKQHNQMGDFILASPLVASLAAAYPDAAIDYLASPVQAEAAALVPEIQRVWRLDGRGVAGRGPRLVPLVRALRRERYDLAISIVTFSYSATSALLLALSGARFRVSGRIAKSPAGRSLFHREVVIPDGGHETDRALAHLAALGHAPTRREPRLIAAREEVEAARLALKSLGHAPGETLVGIWPGAGKLANRWPAARFGEVARRLLARRETRVLLFAGPGEEGLLHRMEVPSCPRVARMPGLTIRKTAALFSFLDLFLGNDTGPLHLAAALGIPTLGLFGPTDPAVYAPISARGRILRAPEKDLSRLSVDAVEGALQESVATRCPGISCRS